MYRTFLKEEIKWHYISLLLKVVCVRDVDTVDSNTQCLQQDYKPCGQKESLLFPPEHKESICVEEMAGHTSYSAAQLECRNKHKTVLELTSAGLNRAFRDLVKGTEDYWLGCKYETRITDYAWESSKNRRIPWRKSELDHNLGKCVSVNSRTGEWGSLSCLESRGFLCQRKTFSDLYDNLPTLTVEYDELPHKVAVGSQLRANCSGFVGTNGAIAFKVYIVTGPRTRRARYPSSQSVKHHQSFKKRHGKCSNFVVATLNWTHGSKVGIGRLECYIVPGGDLSQIEPGCTKCIRTAAESRVHFDYVNVKPRMLVAFHEPPNVAHRGRELEFSCAAYVGQSGNITWSIETEDGTSFIILEDDKLGDITFDVEQKECGTHVKASVKINVSASLNQTRIVCTSFYYRDGVKTNLLTTRSQHIQSRFGPNEPTLDVTYNEDPNILVEGFTFTATCFALVGDSGNIYWSFLDANGTQFGPEKLEKLFIVQHNRTETATEKSGPLVESSIRLLVDRILHGAMLVCRSYNRTYPLSWIKLNSTSREFVVKELPTTQPTTSNNTSGKAETPQSDGKTDPPRFLEEWWPKLLLIFISLVLLVIILCINRMAKRDSDSMREVKNEDVDFDEEDENLTALELRQERNLSIEQGDESTQHDEEKEICESEQRIKQL